MKDTTRRLVRIILVVMMSLLLGAGLWIWSSSDEQKNAEVTQMTADSGIILFYGRECPHCKDLDKIIEENKIAEKVSFDSLEVWHNAKNKEIFTEKAMECGFSEDQLGVPFLYAKGECFVGTPDAEKFLKKEAGIE